MNFNLKRMFGMSQEQKPPDEEIRALEDALALEQTARDFFKTKLGAFIKEQIDQDKQQALLELAKANPWDAEAVQKIQNKYEVCRQIEVYFARAILNGQQAGQILQQMNVNTTGTI
jgi:hypothetical protein